MGRLYLFVKITTLTSRLTKRRTSSGSVLAARPKGSRWSLKRISLILTILLSIIGLVERLVKFTVYLRELEAVHVKDFEDGATSTLDLGNQNVQDKA